MRVRAGLIAVLAFVFSLPAAAQTGPVVMNETGKLLAPRAGSFDGFGSVVAASGDTVVVGATYYGDHTGPGAAYVFVNESGAWTLRATLLPSDGAPGAFFGSAVSISGDVIVVGVPVADHSVADSGSAYVFVKPEGGWNGTLHENARLRSATAESYDDFGRSLAVSGDTIVVAAYSSDVFGPSSGCAYVFVKPAGGWSGVVTENARLLASTGRSYDRFGSAVALDGETVVVGAYWVEGDYGSFAGAAYVFERPASGWGGAVFERARLVASDGHPYAFFGQSVAIDGGTVFVGAADWSYANSPGTGAAYAFERPVGGWSGTVVENARLLASDGAGGDSLGVSIDAVGGLVVVGAHEDDDQGYRSGSAYVFERPGTAWTGTVYEAVKLLASDGESSDGLGFPVAMSNRTVIAGVAQDSDSGQLSGSAYLFALPAHLDYPFASGVAAIPNPAVVTEPIDVVARVSGRHSIAWAQYEVRTAGGEVLVSGTGNSAVCPSPSAPCPADGAYGSTVEHVRATIAPNTLPPGELVVCVRGGDALGHAGDFACDSLTTQPFRYDFRAFFALAPAVTTVETWRTALALKFTLHGDHGMNIFAPNYPQMAQMPCSFDGPGSDPVPVGGLLTYRPETDRYQMTIRIDPAWRGTCRQVRIGLNDGTVHVANFSFAR